MKNLKHFEIMSQYYKTHGKLGKNFITQNK